MAPNATNMRGDGPVLGFRVALPQVETLNPNPGGCSSSLTREDSTVKLWVAQGLLGCRFRVSAV